ncbi:MAG: pectin acetylesterase-family hydrolase [Myxococcota bacterium]
MNDRRLNRLLLLLLALTTIALLGNNDRGLQPSAYMELEESGVTKYMGKFVPKSSEDVGDGWTKHTFDTEDGEGPICISGTEFSVFTRPGLIKSLLIFEQGGGACWQDFYNCNILSEDQEPPGPRSGIFDFDSRDNPFRFYSVVYMPYCDGSVFTGDNEVEDANFPFGPVRYHRGLRNQTAALDLAHEVFPDSKRVTISGSSAGGVGATAFTPFLARFAWGNRVKLTVLNDAGPVTTNLSDTVSVAARAADWDFGKFYPESCTECDDMGQSTAVIKWRLDNDTTVREAFYETDLDQTNRFFLNLLFDPVGFRNLIVTEHGLINEAHPERYKRFIVAGDTSHTALQSDLFYTQDANGVLLNDWTYDFLKGNQSWVDIVEDAQFDF